MGKRTSLYLSDDLAAAARKTGLPLAELVRRGIYGPPAKPVVVPDTPGAEAASAQVSSATAAESWRCGDCQWLQVAGTVSHCEFCGSPKNREVPR
jgi:hypothetical protein